MLIREKPRHEVMVAGCAQACARSTMTTVSEDRGAKLCTYDKVVMLVAARGVYNAANYWRVVLSKSRA